MNRLSNELGYKWSLLTRYHHFAIHWRYTYSAVDVLYTEKGIGKEMENAVKSRESVLSSKYRTRALKKEGNMNEMIW